ncbi:MAG: hypothetical protein ACPGVO_13810 [Spirulinaceae cyanobacterium]
MRYPISPVSLLGLLGVGLLGACSTIASDAAPPTTAIAPNSLAQPVAAVSESPAQSPTQPTVQVYRAAADCETFAVETVAVPEATLEQAVGAAIAQFQTADFPIAGYRVQTQPEQKTATIELRLAPDAPRRFDSLSLCEQFALFGSLRQTATQFAPEEIQTVEFAMPEGAIGG